MDGNALESECSALGGLFVQIINEMKGSTAAWEDFTNKATKLHTALRATILATGAFLDAFQKIADVATNTRGATKDLGSSLTRLCLRHRNIENKLKRFTRSIMDTLVNPLQEKLEEWKRNVGQLDKDHLKEYKKARQEIKRASSDTIKLQKKAKKGKSDVQARLENAYQDVNDKYILLEDTEKNAVRNALIEQRSHFCIYVSCLKPVLDEELAMLSEMSHIQEIVQSLCMQAGDPFNLPPASEEVITDIKGRKDLPGFTFRTPPSSPSSLGSRKSSMCSISSLASSSSGSAQAMSPCHQLRPRPTSQPPSTTRLSSISSQDSGFTSQDTLFQSLMSSSMEYPTQEAEVREPMTADISGVLRWPNKSNRHSTSALEGEMRPHTISAYEKGTRPALTAQTFEPMERPASQTAPPTPNPYAVPCIVPQTKESQPEKEPENKRVSTFKEEVIYESLKPYDMDAMKPPPGPKPRAKSAILQSSSKQGIPSYVNMNELAQLAARKQKEHNLRSQGLAEREETYAQPKIPSVPSSPSVKAPNSLELAQAIKELEESTAALQMTYSSDGTDGKTDAKDVECPTPTQETIGSHYGTSDMATHGSKSGLATIRRGSFSSAHRPSPPVRRSSSILGALPVRPPSVPDKASASKPPQQELIYATPYQVMQHQQSQPHYEPQENIYDKPTAPAPDSKHLTRSRNNSESNLNNQLLQMAQQQLMQQVKSQMGAKAAAADQAKRKSVESVDDLPLPPPPEELCRPEEYAAPAVTQPPAQAGPADLEYSIPAPETVLSDDNDITPTGDPPQDHMLLQIRRGVRLRKSICNDRSAPVLRK